MPADDVVAADRMRDLVGSGTARPLLDGFEPVPTWYRDAWWHVPPDGEDYVPAEPELAAQFDALRARVDRLDAMERGD